MKYCNAKSITRFGAFGGTPHCALPPGHQGPHQTTYGAQFWETWEEHKEAGEI